MQKIQTWPPTRIFDSTNRLSRVEYFQNLLLEAVIRQSMFYRAAQTKAPFGDEHGAALARSGGALDHYGMIRRLRLPPSQSPDVDGSLATVSARRPSDLCRLSSTMRLHRRSGEAHDDVLGIAGQ